MKDEGSERLRLGSSFRSVLIRDPETPDAGRFTFVLANLSVGTGMRRNDANCGQMRARAPYRGSAPFDTPSSAATQGEVDTVAMQDEGSERLPTNKGGIAAVLPTEGEGFVAIKE